MYPSFVSFAAGLALLSAVHSEGMMCLSAALCGMGFGTFAAMAQVAAIQKVPKEKFGTALSTVLSISELGTGVGPFIIGLFISAWGFRCLYMAAAAAVLLCGTAYRRCCVKGLV